MPDHPDPALAATFDPELGRVARIFESHGGTDFGYLAWHFRRFQETKEMFERTAERKGQRVLDVGAHWLHQAFLYAEHGYRVTAADFPITITSCGVEQRAASTLSMQRCVSLSPRKTGIMTFSKGMRFSERKHNFI